MNERTLDILHRGVESAIITSVPQVIIPKLEEKILSQPNQSADLGPRFIEALAERAEKPLPEDIKWLAASAFHFGYAAFWGVLHAVFHERFRPRP